MIQPLLSDDDLLADIGAVPRTDRRVDIWWLGQSGYLLQFDAARVLLDPYLSDSLTRKYANTDNPHVRISRRVIDPKLLRGISVITSTHGHTDHLDAETLAAVHENNPDAILIAPTAIHALAVERFSGPIHTLVAFESCSIGDIEIRAVPASHPTVDRDELGRHKYLGYLIRFGTFTIYHSGDTVVFPEMDRILIDESAGDLDVAILPINGKIGNMSGVDAAGLAKQIGAKLAVPCHYDLFEFNTADPREDFAPECARLRQNYRILRLGERLTLSH